MTSLHTLFVYILCRDLAVDILKSIPSCESMLVKVCARCRGGQAEINALLERVSEWRDLAVDILKSIPSCESMLVKVCARCRGGQAEINALLERVREYN